MAGDTVRHAAEPLWADLDRFAEHAQSPRGAADAPVRVADVLDSLPPEWTNLSGVAGPDPRLADFDHVVVGPGGIFVVDARDWAGTITVVDNVVREDGRSREAETEEFAESALGVAELAGPYAEWVSPVLCVATEEPVADWAVEVRVCSPATLADVMTSGPAGLSPKHVTDAVSLLSGETSPTEDEAEAIAAEVADLPAEVDADSAEAAPAAVPKTTKRRGRAPVPVPAAEDAPDAKAGKDPAKKRRSLVKPIVLLALVAALLAGGPKVYPSVKAMVAEQLSGGTPACVPAAVPTPAAATSAHAAKPGTKKKSAAKPARSKKARLAARRAAAEKRALAQTQALAGPAC